MTDFTKDPDASLDYSIDWTNWLTGTEIIASSTWESSNGATIESSSYTDKVSTVYVSGGTLNTICRLTNTIETNASPARIDQRTITLLIKDK